MIKKYILRSVFLVPLSISLALLFSSCVQDKTIQSTGAETSPEPTTTPAKAIQKPAQPPRIPASSQATEFILAPSYTGEVKALNKVDLTAKAAGRIKEIKVQVGDKVKKGDLLIELEHEILDIQVRQAEAALAVARANLAKMEEGSRKEQIAIDEATLKSAQAQLDLLLDGATKEQIAEAKANLDGAQAQLNALLAGPTQEQIQVALSKVRAAEEKLKLEEIETERTLLTTKILDAASLDYAINSRNAKLAQYQVALDIARDELNSLKAPPKTAEVAKLKAAVDAAKAKLDSLLAPARPQQVAQNESMVASAKQKLEITKSPFRAEDMEISRIEVQKAQAALELAKTQREEAFLYGPFEGAVLTRMASEGTLASPSMALLTLISREIEISIAIEEAAVGKLKTEQIWDIKVLAYPNTIFKAKVKAISPALNPATRTFEVLLSPQDPQGILLPGMFVTASLPQR